MSSTEMSPTRASLAAESAAEFPPNANMAANPDKNNLSLSFLYINLKSELRLDDHISGLILTVSMKENQYQKRFSFGIINMFES